MYGMKKHSTKNMYRTIIAHLFVCHTFLSCAAGDPSPATSSAGGVGGGVGSLMRVKT